MQFMKFVGQFPNLFDWSINLNTSRSSPPKLWRLIELILAENSL